ncbi:hypothetical protein FHW73_002688 [Luteimonas sp. RC10]|nr:hypothetical protein [Luteimonas sp. RC10]
MRQFRIRTSAHFCRHLPRIAGEVGARSAPGGGRDHLANLRLEAEDMASMSGPHPTLHP